MSGGRDTSRVWLVGSGRVMAEDARLFIAFLFLCGGVFNSFVCLFHLYRLYFLFVFVYGLLLMLFILGIVCNYKCSIIFWDVFSILFCYNFTFRLDLPHNTF